MKEGEEQTRKTIKKKGLTVFAGAGDAPDVCGGGGDCVFGWGDPCLGDEGCESCRMCGGRYTPPVAFGAEPCGDAACAGGVTSFFEGVDAANFSRITAP